MRGDGEQDRPLWHYINFPFKTEGELESIEPKPLHPVDTLSALAENERIVRREAPAEAEDLNGRRRMFPSYPAGTGAPTAMRAPSQQPSSRRQTILFSRLWGWTGRGQ